MLLLRGRLQVVLRDGLTLVETCHKPLGTPGGAVQCRLLCLRLIAASFNRVCLNIIFITRMTGTRVSRGFIQKQTCFLKGMRFFTLILLKLKLFFARWLRLSM